MTSTPRGSQRIEQSTSLEDPGVICACLNMFCVGRPADAADRLGELELAVASSMAVGREGARAVDRYDCRPVRYDNVNDLPARQVALERQNPAIIDDRYVETLPLCAHINASPHSHASKHAPPRCRSRSGSARRL